jgi:hypothetical protein
MECNLHYYLKFTIYVHAGGSVRALSQIYKISNIIVSCLFLGKSPCEGYPQVPDILRFGKNLTEDRMPADFRKIRLARKYNRKRKIDRIY